MKDISHHLVSAEGSHETREQSKATESRRGPVVGGDAALETHLLSVPDRPANVRGKLRHLAAG